MHLKCKRRSCVTEQKSKFVSELTQLKVIIVLQNNKSVDTHVGALVNKVNDVENKLIVEFETSSDSFEEPLISSYSNTWKTKTKNESKKVEVSLMAVKVVSRCKPKPQGVCVQQEQKDGKTQCYVQTCDADGCKFSNKNHE